MTPRPFAGAVDERWSAGFDGFLAGEAKQVARERAGGVIAIAGVFGDCFEEDRFKVGGDGGVEFARGGWLFACDLAEENLAEQYGILSSFYPYYLTTVIWGRLFAFMKLNFLRRYENRVLR